METDREVYRLAMRARAAGLSDVFDTHEPHELRAALGRARRRRRRGSPSSTTSCRSTAGAPRRPATSGVPSWIEDNTIPLGLVKTFLKKDDDHDFEAAARNAMAEREEAIENARTGLTREEQAVFDAGLQSNQEANFPWWQDDHNYYIDLKVMLPLRWGCQELARRENADHTRRHALPVLAGAHGRRRRPHALPGRAEEPGRRAPPVLRPLARPAQRDAQGAGHDPRGRRGPDPHRDLRAEPGVDQGRAEPRRRQADGDEGRRRGQGHRPRHRPRPAVLRRDAPPRARLDPGLRVDVAELDAGVRQDRGRGLRRRRHALARRDRRPRVRRPDRDRAGRRHDLDRATATRSRWTAPPARSRS